MFSFINEAISAKLDLVESNAPTRAYEFMRARMATQSRFSYWPTPEEYSRQSVEVRVEVLRLLVSYFRISQEAERTNLLELYQIINRF